MRVTKRTRTRAVLPLLTGDKLVKALEDIKPIQLKKQVLEMTLGEFIEAMSPDYVMRFSKERRAYMALGKIRQFRDEMEAIAKLMNRYQVRQTDDERMAALGIAFPTTPERMLLDVQTRLGLCRLSRAPWPVRMWQRSAEEVTVSEYLIILKEQGSQAQYQRKFAKIQETKRKQYGRISSRT